MSVIFGFVGIRPEERSLSEVAMRLTSAFGIDFEFDESGKYEELPAYCAQALGIQFALLGLPEQQLVETAEPMTDFTLQVLSLDNLREGEDMDLSDYLARLISRCAKLEAYVLK